MSVGYTSLLSIFDMQLNNSMKQKMNYINNDNVKIM